MATPAQVPAHWGSLPGYGESIDPKKLPPYVEDLGDGNAHEVEVDGSEKWYQRGVLHRDGDLPAFVRFDGYQAWYQHGARHRDGGKPARIWRDGTEEWWVNGQRRY